MTSEKGSDEFFTLEKVYIEVIKSYNGESAIVPTQENTIFDNTRLVLSGAKGITESDKVKVQ